MPDSKVSAPQAEQSIAHRFGAYAGAEGIGGWLLFFALFQAVSLVRRVLALAGWADRAASP